MLNRAATGAVLPFAGVQGPAPFTFPGGTTVSEVELSTALEALRDELEQAWQASQGRAVRFRAAEVKLTFETVAKRDRDGSGKIRWWVVEGGGGVKTGNEKTQTLSLTLTPMLE